MKVSEFIQFEWLHPTIKESMIEGRSQVMTPKGYVKTKFQDSDISKGLRPISKDASWNLEEYIQLMKVKSHNRYMADKIKSGYEMLEQDIIDLDTFCAMFVKISQQLDTSIEGVLL
jgi:NAD+--asparagine ADP-ribosyltransferase